LDTPSCFLRANFYEIFVENCRMCRLWDNVNVDVKEIKYGNVDWIQLARGRFQWQAFLHMVMELGVP
jgi:hypothetical protein